MKIKHLDLKDFRGIHNLELELDGKSTVFLELTELENLQFWQG